MNLYDRCEPIPISGCFVWNGATVSGYGCLRLNGKTLLAHRVSYEIEHGDIPKGMHVLHRCDVRPCINPLHLFLGTNSDNIADSASKGRRKGIKRNRPSGLKYKNYSDERLAALGRPTSNERKRIRFAYEIGIRTSFLAEKYKVSKRTIYNILKRKD